MTRNPEARTWLDFRQTVADRVGTKTAVVAITSAGTELWRFEPDAAVLENIERRLWPVGRFYAAGGPVSVEARWKAERWPKFEEAMAIESALGLKVHAAYHRRIGINPFPALLSEFG